MGHYNLTRKTVSLATLNIPAINTFTSGEVAHGRVVAVARGGDAPHVCAVTADLAPLWRSRAGFAGVFSMGCLLAFVHLPRHVAIFAKADLTKFWSTYSLFWGMQSSRDTLENPGHPVGHWAGLICR